MTDYNKEFAALPYSMPDFSEKTIWVGTKEKLLEKFNELPLRDKELGKVYKENAKFDVAQQLATIEQTGFPGQVFYITQEKLKEKSKKDFIGEIIVTINSQYVDVRDFEVERFTFAL